MAAPFDTLSSIIKNRRTIKPPEMNGEKVPDEQINALLELADWAPTHANTEPWRFIVYTDGKDFGKHHAELYKAAAGESFVQVTYDKLFHMGDKASHVIISYMQRKQLTRIPVLEELAATACAIQNILLVATAAGIASYWGSGGMILKTEMKNFYNSATMMWLWAFYTWDIQTTNQPVKGLPRLVKKLHGYNFSLSETSAWAGGAFIIKVKANNKFVGAVTYGIKI